MSGQTDDTETQDATKGDDAGTTDTEARDDDTQDSSDEAEGGDAGDGDGGGDSGSDDGDEQSADGEGEKGKSRSKKSAKKAAKTEREQKRREYAKDPTVRAMIKAAADEAKKAVREELEAKAKRERMSESERLTAEKDEAIARAKAAEDALSEAQLERDYADAVSALEDVRIKPKFRKYARTLVAEAMASDEQLSVQEALEDVREEYGDDLFVPVSAPRQPSKSKSEAEGQDGEQQQRKPRSRASTARTSRYTQTPADKTKERVDVAGMNKQQFKEFAKRLGLH